MIAELGCNCTCWYKIPSSWPTSNLLRHPALKTGTQTSATGRKKMFIHSFGSFVEHNGRRNHISFSCHNILKRRDSRQLEIHVSEPRIRRQPILFISYPLIPPCICPPRPPLFLAAQIIDQPPSASGGGLWRRGGGGGNFIGPEPNNLINIAPLAPFSFSLSPSLSSSPPSVFRL